MSFFFASCTVLLDHCQPGMRERPLVVAEELSSFGGHRDCCLTHESSIGTVHLAMQAPIPQAHPDQCWKGAGVFML